MGDGVAFLDPAIMAAADNLPALGHNRADWQATFVITRLSLSEGIAHECAVLVACFDDWQSLALPALYLVP